VIEDARGTLTLGRTEERERLGWLVLRIVATPVRPVQGRPLPTLWDRASLRRHPELKDVPQDDLDDMIERLIMLDCMTRGRDGKLLLVEVPEMPLGMHLFRIRCTKRLVVLTSRRAQIARHDGDRVEMGSASGGVAGEWADGAGILRGQGLQARRASLLGEPASQG
jgi:hypothetical protein